MATRTLPLTVDEFHKLYDGAKPAYEYCYGAAVQKTMPTVLHAFVQFIIALLLENDGWNTGIEVRLKVAPEAEPVPDVIAVRGVMQGPYPLSAPELCIEILSPGDSLKETFEKAGRYLAWGTQHVWIIDPEKRIAWTLSSENASAPTAIPATGTLRVRETAIDLPVLFAAVDRKLER